MRIIIAAPLYPPEIGGPATYAKILEEELPKRGIEVALVKFSEVRRLPKLLRHYAYFKKVLRAARGADVVLALDPVSVGLPALKAAQRAGKPFIVKIVGDYAWEQGRQRFGVKEDLNTFVAARQKSFFIRMLQKIQTRVARSATRVIVPSEYLKGIICHWGIQREKIEVIYNAVSLETPGTIPTAVAALPRPLIVSAGRLVPWKHFDGVIDAVALLRGRGIAASLAIVGDGPLRSGLEERAREKLGNSCVFTGSLAHKDALAVLKSAEIFVLNSSYEGLSHFLIEALSLGVPSIATDVGGNPEVITQAENGLLVPVGDTGALASALSHVISEDATRARIAERAKESAKRFSLGAMITATVGLLQSL
ncbi:glycosyltransferase family 4 protein [Candidatus Kaiserbacteria bacterium]|nr:glycosyltransferase family 4 protein [Candidatus Kaiserbacteria bacterium]